MGCSQTKLFNGQQKCNIFDANQKVSERFEVSLRGAGWILNPWMGNGDSISLQALMKSAIIQSFPLLAAFNCCTKLYDVFDQKIAWWSNL